MISVDKISKKSPNKPLSMFQSYCINSFFIEISGEIFNFAVKCLCGAYGFVMWILIR